MTTRDSARPRPFVPEMEARRHVLDGVSGWEDFTPDKAAAWGAPYGPVEEWDLQIEDRVVDGPHGPIPIRIYRPTDGGTGRPGLVWCHGGGFVGGDLNMPEGHQVSRGIAGRAGAVVVSVDYRLCPSPPGTLGFAGQAPSDADPVRFPVPHDDVLSSYRWTRDHASELGIDPVRVAVGGASAGANLAAGVTLHLCDDGDAPWQVLLAYPLVHPEMPEPSAELAAAIAVTPPLLRFPPEVARMLNENYLGAGVVDVSPYAFAGLSPDLSAFPPTLIDNDEFDDLRCSGERFAAQLEAAGVAVEQVMTAGVPHGHLNNVGFGPARASLDRMAGRLTR